MTLVIAAPGPDFMIVGADSRGTIIEEGGTRVEINTVRKIIPIGEHVTILLYGATNEATYLLEQYQSTLRSQQDGVTQIAQGFRNFCREEARADAGVPVRYFPDFGFVVAGLDRLRRRYVPKAYSLRSTSGFRLGSYQRFALAGKPMIGYYIFASYYEPDLTLNQLCKLVAVTISETQKIDGDVGGPIRMAAIEANGTREIADQDIRNYIRGWARNKQITTTEEI
jgi:20S proteasome alpha/beta subunit